MKKASALHLIILLLAASLLSTDCSGRPRLTTASDVAAALQTEGLPFTSQAAASLPKMRYGRIDEGLTLRGENLSVDIIRIEDERTYKAFLGMGALLGAAEAKTGDRLPGRPDLFTYRPFVIVVRSEPKPGMVRSALKAVLGEETS